MLGKRTREPQGERVFAVRELCFSCLLAPFIQRIIHIYLLYDQICGGVRGLLSFTG